MSTGVSTRVAPVRRPVWRRRRRLLPAATCVCLPPPPASCTARRSWARRVRRWTARRRSGRVGTLGLCRNAASTATNCTRRQKTEPDRVGTARTCWGRGSSAWAVLPVPSVFSTIVTMRMKTSQVSAGFGESLHLNIFFHRRRHLHLRPKWRPSWQTLARSFAPCCLGNLPPILWSSSS